MIEGATFSSITRSTATASNGSDKMAGTMHPIFQSYRDVRGLTVCTRRNRYVVNSEIAVVKHEAIESGLVADCRHDVWNEAWERRLGRCSSGTNSVVVSFPPDLAAYVADCRFELGRKKSNVELACRSNGNGLRRVREPSSGEVEREIKVEQ